MASKTKVVLSGCGGISRAWLKPVREFADVEIVGLMDINEENARKIQTEFELANASVGTNLAALLNQTRPDVLFDCSIPGAHATNTILALSKGCHVLGEKPMAENMTDAARMLDAARQSGKIYAVMQNRRYLDKQIQFTALVQSGEIGPLTTLHSDFMIGAHFGGFRDVMEHVLLLDMAIHSFDQARMISGKDPLSAYCHEWNPPGSWYAHGASAVVIFEMTDNVVLTYRGSWCAEGMNTSWECDWRAIGAKGSALWDGRESIKGQAANGEEGFFKPQRDLSPAPLPPLSLTGHAALIRDFLDCLRSGRTPQTVCTDNVKSLAMVHAAIESARAGAKIPICC